MRADRELACDALVLARTHSDEPKRYGRIIVNLLERFSRPRPLPGMAGIMETKSQLKRRIAMIAKFKKNSYQWSPIAVALIIILACISLPDAKRTKASETSAAKPSQMVVRRLWAGAPDAFSGAPSPDGKYLSYVNWKTGDLGVHELATGTNRQLTNEGWDKGFAGYSVFSPDSKQLAYYFWSNEKESGQLRIIGIDGSGSRVVRLNEGTSIIMPAGWSADGKHILARGGTKGEFSQILLIRVEDGDLRVLKTLRHQDSGRYLESRRKAGMSLSPDGRYVAYTFLPGEDSANRDISVLAVDGSRDIPLVRHVADDFVVGWAPDGRGIVFASDRTGSMGIWGIEVVDGKPQGTPHLLTPEIGQFNPMGFTRDGSYYYGVAFRGSNVYVATYDPQKENVTGKPVLSVKRYEGSNEASDWSPDGRYLACVSMRPDAGGIFLIHSVDTGQVRELSPDIKFFKVNSLRWSADGRSLLCAVRNEDVDWGLLRVDVETGEGTMIVEDSGALYPNWSADGKAVFYVRRALEGWRIIRRDLTTNEEKELFRPTVVWAGGIVGLALSPDGKQLAFHDFDAGMLKILSVTGGQPRELVKVGRAVRTIAWTPDGRHLVYRSGGLRRISAGGGEPQRLDLEIGSRHVRFHPDGRRITFTAGANGKSEVWVMENFLPETPVANSAEMVVRRVWANAWDPHFTGAANAWDPHFTGAPSADGKYLSYVNWKTGDLAVRELATGTNRQLTNEGWEKGFAVNSAFSPDSKQVAYYWWNEQKDSGQLRIVGLDGSGPRAINLNKEPAMYAPLGWTPDGKCILASCHTEDKSLQILLVPFSRPWERSCQTARGPRTCARLRTGDMWLTRFHPARTLQIVTSRCWLSTEVGTFPWSGTRPMMACSAGRPMEEQLYLPATEQGAWVSGRLRSPTVNHKVRLNCSNPKSASSIHWVSPKTVPTTMGSLPGEATFTSLRTTRRKETLPASRS
jgi:Tol biopolymer transport system component